MRTSFMLAALLGVTAMATPTDSPRLVTIRAFDFRFEAPATIPAGTITFRLKNSGLEVHHLWIVQLKDGKTPADFMAATKIWGSALKMPSWAVDVGGPNSASPGEMAEGTVTLEPGTYMLVCWVPSPDGVVHVMKGMIRPLTVTAKRATPAAEPAVTTSMVLDDYSFTFSQPLVAGRQTIRVENRAEQSHEVVIARLLPDRTLRDAVMWMNGGHVGRPPVDVIGGASGLANGRHMYLNIDFKPGRYVLLCFIPDAKNGKPHSDLGMVKEIVIDR
jgi:uncharacterized cupredoxin-like copper-binding protein